MSSKNFHRDVYFVFLRSYSVIRMAEKKKDPIEVYEQETHLLSFVFKLPLTDNEKQDIIKILHKPFVWDEKYSSYQIKKSDDEYIEDDFEKKIEEEKVLRKNAFALAETGLLDSITIAFAASWNRRDDFAFIRDLVRKYTDYDEYDYYRERDKEVDELGEIVSRIKYLQVNLKSWDKNENDGRSIVRTIINNNEEYYKFRDDVECKSNISKFKFDLKISDAEKRIIISILEKDFEFDPLLSSVKMKQQDSFIEQKKEDEKKLKKTALAFAKTGLFDTITIALAASLNRRDHFYIIMKIIEKHMPDESPYYLERKKAVNDLSNLMSRIKYTQNYLKPRNGMKEFTIAGKCYKIKESDLEKLQSAFKKALIEKAQFASDVEETDDI